MYFAIGVEAASQSVAAQPVGFEAALRSCEQSIISLRTNTNEVPQNQVVVAVSSCLANLLENK